MEREKIMNALRCHANCDRGFDCGDCAYIGNGDCLELLAMDVYALLKEQEAVEPKFVRNEWRCGACGHVVLTYCFDINEGEMGKVMANYCPSCGRKVKWE